MCVKLAQAAAFICGTSGICWWEQTEAPPGSASLLLLQEISPAVLGTSGVASAGAGPWFWLQGAGGGQLTAVISPCCSLSAAQAPLHCKDIAARQLGRVGREFSQRCQSVLGEAESCSPVVSEAGLEKVINYNLSIIPLNKKWFKETLCNKPLRQVMSVLGCALPF